MLRNVVMLRPESMSPLDHPLIFRGLVKHLTTVFGINGEYAAIHDSLVIQEFCETFNISLDAVSAQLETYVHASPEGIN
jgi:hypothetical protein